MWTWKDFVYHTKPELLPKTVQKVVSAKIQWNFSGLEKKPFLSPPPTPPSFQAKAYQSKQILQNREKYVLFLSLDFRVFLTIASVSIQMWAKV